MPMNRACRALLPCLLLLPACTGVSGESECSEAPTLAAGGAPLALSCAETVEFHDRDYRVGCLSVHETRKGGILVDNGGETSYRGARAIKGLAPARAFILLGGGCRRRSLVATVEDFEEPEFDSARLPFGVRGPSVAVPYRTVSSGQIISLGIDAPKSFVWGADSYLERRTEKEWKRVLLLFNYLDRKVNTSAPVASAAVDDIGYHGDAIVRVRLRKIPPGDYRITKEFFRPGSESVDSRSITRSVRVRIRSLSP